ncbi:MAG: TrmB family transcriptional regulator [Candidatus Hodarchaeales archaeon]|jgi:sugar-specific transcriptional regulator TrmB
MRTFEDLLTELGLNSTESKIYSGLLTLGLSKASAVARAAGISRVQVYPVLESLYNKNFVQRTEYRGKPTVFKAVPITEVLLAIKHRRDQEFDNLSKKLLKTYETIKQAKKTNNEESEVLLYSGWDRVLPMLHEELNKSQESIILAIDPKLLMNKYLKDLLNEIIKTKNIYGLSNDELIIIKDLDHYLKLNEQLINNEIGTRYRKTPENTGNIFIDESIAILIEGNKSEVFAIHSTHPLMLKFVRNYFENMHNKILEPFNKQLNKIFNSSK